MTAIKTYELTTKFDRKKSFYHKARVTVDNSGNKVLTSYTTAVCYIDKDNRFHRLWDNYSATTMRHINEFICQEGIEGGGKDWWCRLPVEKLIL